MCARTDDGALGYDDVQQEFTSAGGESMWETFTLSAVETDGIKIEAVGGKHLPSGRCHCKQREP